MRRTRDASRPRARTLGLLVGVTALLASACTSTPASGPVTVTVTTGSSATAAASAGDPAVTLPPTTTPSAGITVVDPADATLSSGPDTGPPSSGPDASASPTAPASTAASSSAAPTTTAPPKPEIKAAAITVSPKAGARGVEPLGRISVTATGGRLLWVKVINPEGRTVEIGKDLKGSRWSVDPELGFSRLYTVQVASRSTQGRVAITSSTFTTLQPRDRVSLTITPSAGARVGIGQPVEITFSKPIDPAYRRQVEKMISVTSTANKVGGFRWYSNTVVRWRPATMWERGAAVTVQAKIYGKQLSPGLYGAEDQLRGFSVGRKMQSIVDAKAHRMYVYLDGKLVRTIPVSLGNAKYPTPNGIYVVSQKLATHVMDSSTWGLKGAGAYRTRVKWATRMSSGGVFVHGAPWSEYAQGNTNVSHGCVNMTDAAAQWFQQVSMAGDPITVVNSSGPTLQAWDGFGDWNIPWGKY